MPQVNVDFEFGDASVENRVKNQFHVGKFDLLNKKILKDLVISGSHNYHVGNLRSTFSSLSNNNLV